MNDASGKDTWRQVDAFVQRFEEAWQKGDHPAIEDFLPMNGPDRLPVLKELVKVDRERRSRAGESVRDEDYLEHFPELATDPPSITGPTTIDETPRQDTVYAEATATHQFIGRYRLEKSLGEGGFGIVYLAYDKELQRQVAIKVPKAHRITSPKDAEAYLVEAQILAKLDHPHIVPVYDVGRSDDGLPFVVSKFIEGCSLADRIKQARLAVREAIVLIARMAGALQYAHQHRLVHRDVKPGNILIDASNKPFLVDFGLALKEEDFGKGGGILGTPAYMSPEQANGEGHLVDGRSDIFSLGVVLYELLTGRRPFTGASTLDILMQITTLEVRPPRQLDPTMPRELERITLKALAKKASERYATALDFADDLQHWLEPKATPEQGPTPLKVIPKGLRSFDADDADFFLELLPGPRDRDGLPDTLRFWKNHIEATEGDKTFRVGVIYGPSGCGKSSLVKAGLLPRLAESVRAVYVEATGEDTEARLLKGLRRQVPDLPDNLSLIESLAALRRGHHLEPGKKVLLILDQFEQWLHAQRDEQNTDLVQALRQCDGGRVQSLVMVRDDFWMAVTRFWTQLQIDLLQGQNCAATDLFDLDHAKKVLVAFGRAFGKLPEEPTETSKEQKHFLSQAILGLSQEGKVICVRLALFAEMMKGKPWTPATLKEVGGTEGVGITFLEDTFSSPTANPKHRLHERAARAVLKALLPGAGTDIKGHMQSYAELLEASGYNSHQKDFDDLIRILDYEIRLITPTDLEGQEQTSTSQEKPGAKYYQLTHDYLVHSLRDWLTRKQKETRRGRAEIRLTERAAAWSAKPENRHLPAWWEWANIRLFTSKRNWTPRQRKMMRKAGRYHVVRGAVVAVLLTVATITGLTIQDQVEEQRKATYADGLVQSLLNANIAQVPAIVNEMAGYRKWTDPRLREENNRTALKSPQKLHTSLALLPVDATQVEYLYRRLLDAEPPEVPVIRDALAAHKHELVNRLWGVVEKPEKGFGQQRLWAACALASYAVPDHAQGSARWRRASTTIVDELLAAVQKNPSHYATLLEQLHPVRASLSLPLKEVYQSNVKPGAERSFATNILADYAADKPDDLANLLMDADEKQFGVVFPKLREHGEKALALLTAEIDKKLLPDMPSSDKEREKLAKRQANAAVALLMMNHQDKVWLLLKHSPDPRVRSYLIHRFGPLGADARVILKRLDIEPDITIRRALILSLGAYGEKELPADARSSLLPKLQETYGKDSDPGLHASAEWLLRHWQQEVWLKQVNEEWAKDKDQRERRIKSIQELLQKDRQNAPPQWYVNSQGQTFVVIPGPVEFLMGSPVTEKNRFDNEVQHKKRVGRTFALAAKPVTMEQYQKFERDYNVGEAIYHRTADLPVVGTEWYRAALYCIWLSKKEGIAEEQWCYEIKGKEIKLRADYLSLSGYRLPTEAEMEYATRAGARTARYYGETEELLPKYAWYNKNSQEQTWPVGSLKPNDLGLFDLQGNVLTWCQESYRAYSGNEDKEDALPIISTQSRVLRGGSFNNQAVVVRSASRTGIVPTYRIGYIGFRPARTSPLGSFTALTPTPEGGRK